MDQWAHDTAAALLNAEDRSLANADNTMGWQPLIFWYNKPGFEDVKKAVDAAEKRLPAIAQRATVLFVQQDLKQDVLLMETTHGMMHRQCFLQERLV